MSRTKPANLPRLLTLLFLLMAATLIGLTTIYWFNVLEPRLYSEAKSQAGVLANAQSVALLKALDTGGEVDIRRLHEAVDEILILTDPATDSAFVRRLELRVDPDVVSAPAGSLDFSEGEEVCASCFVTDVPIYSERSGAVLAIVTYHSSDAFFQQLRRDVRSRLVIGAFVLLFILLLIWLAVRNLVERIQFSEAAAAAAARAKSEFLANMSHEIRTPMNGILGTVNILLKTAPSKDQQQHLEIIARSGEELLVILDDILDISKLESGRLTLDRCNFSVHEIVLSAIQLMKSRADEKNLALLVDCEGDIAKRVWGDPIRVRQILLNLLSNAIKFTHRGTVTVRWRVRDRSSDCTWIRFEVRDTGIGIAREVLPKLFQEFTQADSSVSRKYGGTGLGLAICRRLTTALGGTISVDSRLGRGSLFAFELPFEVAGDTGEEPLAVDEVHFQALSILLAEDNAINRRVARALLEHEGHRVTEAVDGQAAVDAVLHDTFDVILMDLHMPGIDGLEATRQIRNLPDPQRAEIPIIALTADVLTEEQQRCEAAGMDGFVAKPFKMAELNAAFYSGLRKRAAGRSPAAL